MKKEIFCKEKVKSLCPVFLYSFLNIKHPKLIFLITFLLYVLQSNAQIVPNGDFEDYTSIPRDVSQITRARGWFSPTSTTPDYFHRQGPYQCGIPVNNWGTQSPEHENNPINNAFAGIIVYGKDEAHLGDPHWSEYIEIKLTRPLTAKRRYKVKFWVNPTDKSPAYVKKIGAYFTRDSLTYQYPYTKVIDVSPQIVPSNADRWLDDTYYFMPIEGVLEVPENTEYNFITIGLFEKEVTYTGDLPDEDDNHVYYYIDDVSIEETCSAFYPVAEAGNDTSVCKGSQLSLSIPEDGEWNYGQFIGLGNLPITGNIVTPGAFNALYSVYVLTVTKNGCTNYDTIKVYVQNCCNCKDTCIARGNLITDGDFEKNTINWTGDYNPDGVLTPGHNGVIQDASLFSNSYDRTEGKDHTYYSSGNGHFLFADGHSDNPLINPFVPAPNRIWCNLVNVKAGMEYDFSAWFMNLIKNTQELSSYDDPVVQFSVNGSLIGEQFTIPKTASSPLVDKWGKQSSKWYSGQLSGMVNVCINMMTNKYWGNDLGIDDICFVECKPSAGPDRNLCAGEQISLPIPELAQGITWKYEVLSGDNNGLTAPNIAKPNVTTQYILITENPAKGCKVYDTVTIFIKKCCSCPEKTTGGYDLVINGDFEQGFAGFTSDYVINAGPGTSPGDYSVVSTVDGFNNSWQQHGNLNNFLYVDGHLTADKAAWRQTIKGLEKGGMYVFCMDVNNLIVPQGMSWLDDPTVEVRINGTAIGSVTVPETPDDWVRVSYRWTADTSFAKIEIVSTVLIQNGVDFGIDNIAFRPCRSKIRDRHLLDTVICLDKPHTLPSSSQEWPNWKYDVISEGTPYSISNPTVSPVRTTTYLLSAFDYDKGFADSDTSVVTVKCCWCGGNTTPNQNLITNGDFSGGNTGFYSNYYYNSSTGVGGAGGYDGSYAVAPNSTPFNSNWDKTGNTGKFLLANGATIPNQYVWQQTVSVQPNTSYSLCSEFINLNSAPGFPTSKDPVINVKINGTSIGTYVADEVYTWTPFSATWNSGSNTTATIEMYSQNTSSTGNDFGIDNVSFAPCGSSSSGKMQPMGVSNTAQNESAGFHVYPNPASDNISVLADIVPVKGHIIITDILGKIIMQLPVEAKETEINISGLATGTYLISLQDSGQLIGKKIFTKQ